MCTKTLAVETETILESIPEWDGSFDELTDDLHTQIPLIISCNWGTIEKELMCSTKEHHSVKKNRCIMNLLGQTTESEISGYEDSQPSSLERKITSQKYMAMSMDEFLDSHPLPANIKEIEDQSNGKNLHFLRSIDPTNIKKEVSDSLDYANSFWNVN